MSASKYFSSVCDSKESINLRRNSLPFQISSISKGDISTTGNLPMCREKRAHSSPFSCIAFFFPETKEQQTTWLLKFISKLPLIKNCSCPVLIFCASEELKALLVNDK